MTREELSIRIRGLIAILLVASAAEAKDPVLCVTAVISEFADLPHAQRFYLGKKVTASELS